MLTIEEIKRKVDEMSTEEKVELAKALLVKRNFLTWLKHPITNIRLLLKIRQWRKAKK